MRSRKCHVIRDTFWAQKGPPRAAIRGGLHQPLTSDCGAGRWDGSVAATAAASATTATARSRHGVKFRLLIRGEKRADFLIRGLHEFRPLGAAIFLRERLAILREFLIDGRDLGLLVVRESADRLFEVRDLRGGSHLTATAAAATGGRLLTISGRSGRRRIVLRTKRGERRHQAEGEDGDEEFDGGFHNNLEESFFRSGFGWRTGRGLSRTAG